MILPLAFAALAPLSARTVSAHGFVSNITIAGKEYPGYDANTLPYSNHPNLIAWSTTASDQGYVDDLSSPDIICHEGAEPGALSAEIPAGGTVTVTWNQWLSDHKGPVIDYLAACNGSCSNVDKTALRFFKVDQDGLNDGVWGSDKLIEQGNSWDITIPEDIQAGEYVLRHEIIALQNEGQPQAYPQCVNLKVTGGGDVQPAGVPGMDLYSGDEPGLTVDISNMKGAGYEVPGPKLVSDATSTAAATGIAAPTTANTPFNDLYGRSVDQAAEDWKRSFLDAAVVISLGGFDWNCTRL
ncbi:glycosyl hydrolase family 61-domain-containing protein [Aspergillus unguis]